MWKTKLPACFPAVYGATPPVFVSRRFGSASATQLSFPTTGTDGYILKNSSTKMCMPALGFGTWGCDHFDNDTIARSVEHALKVGYRHFDCARVYANEKELGQVFKDAFDNGICKREDVFITSKLFNHEHAPPDDIPLQVLEDSLKNLQLDYLDGWLIHWPFRNLVGSNMNDRIAYNGESWTHTLKLMYDCELKGLTKSVGVCNATITKLTEMIDYLKKVLEYNNDDKNGLKAPAIHQVEIHPYFQQDKLIDFCNVNDIIVTAALPLGSPERPARCRRDDDPIVLNDSVIGEISKEIGCSPAQVIIRWHLQRGIVVIPKATENWMIEENFNSLKLSLTSQQMDRISKIDRNFRLSRAEMFSWYQNQKWETMWDYQ